MPCSNRASLFLGIGPFMIVAGISFGVCLAVLFAWWMNGAGLDATRSRHVIRQRTEAWRRWRIRHDASTILAPHAAQDDAQADAQEEKVTQ